MPEPFPSFGSNFRVAYSSIVAFSTTVLLGLVIIPIQNSTQSSLNSLKLLQFIAGSILVLSIGIAFFSMFWGLYNEKEEGASSTFKGQRGINRVKYKILAIAAFLAFIGLALTTIYLVNFIEPP